MDTQQGVVKDGLDVEISKDSSSISVWTNTAKDGTGTKYQPVVDSDGHVQVDVLSTATNLGSSKHGTTTGLAISASTNLVSYVAISGDKLRGFSAISDRVARFRLKVNGTTVLAGRADVGTQTYVNYIPVAIALSVSDTVTLEVTNESTQGTSTSEGTIIIEQ